MILAFHGTTKQYLFNTGTCSGAPVYNEGQLLANKENYMTDHSLTEEDWDALTLVAINDNSDMAQKILMSYVPVLKDVLPEESEETEEKVIETKEQVMVDSNGPVKDENGDYVMETVETTETIIISKNADFLTDDTEWELESSIQAYKDAAATKKTAKEALKAKLEAGTATLEEIQEYLTL